MKTNINAWTTVEVSNELAVFRTEESTGKISKKVLYINLNRIYGCELSYMKFFSFRSFLTFFIVGALAAFGYYAYNVYYVDMVPDLYILGGLGLGGILLGLMRAFKKKRHLVIIAESDGMNVITKSRFSFPVGKEIKDKGLEEMMQVLVR